MGRAIVAQGKGIPPKYFHLRHIAHVPFVLYLKVEPTIHRGQRLNPEELRQYRELLQNARNDMLTNATYAFTDNEKQLQNRVLDESERFVNSTLKEGGTTVEKYKDYSASVRKDVKALADLAGQEHVDAIHGVITKWRQNGTLSPEDWNKVRVLNLGLKQPRCESAVTQYFNWCFKGESNSVFPGETTRVVYVETPKIVTTDREWLIERNSAAAVVLDRIASELLFGDPGRMSVDIVADGARARIKELKWPIPDIGGREEL